jgi:hypothetical protein
MIKHASRRAFLVQLPQNWIVMDTNLSENFISKALGATGSKHVDSACIFSESAEYSILLLRRKYAVDFSANRPYIRTITGTTTRYRKGSVMTSTSGLLSLLPVKPPS